MNKVEPSDMMKYFGLTQ